MHQVVRILDGSPSHHQETQRGEIKQKTIPGIVPQLRRGDHQYHCHRIRHKDQQFQAAIEARVERQKMALQVSLINLQSDRFQRRCQTQAAYARVGAELRDERGWILQDKSHPPHAPH